MDYKSILSIINDESKAFIDVDRLSIASSEVNVLLIEINNILIDKNASSFKKIKTAALLSYLISNGYIKKIKTIEDFLEYSNINVTKREYYILASTNKKLTDLFKENKAIFELFKYMVANDVYKLNTSLYYISWMCKYKFDNYIDPKEMIDLMKSGQSFKSIIDNSNAVIVCERCNKILPVKYFEVMHTVCKDCTKKNKNKYEKNQELETLSNRKNASESRKVISAIEERISEFKSNNTDDNVHTSKEYIMYEGIHSTIINNLYEILDLDLTKLSESEKHNIESNNKQITKLIERMEEKLWEQT